MKFRSFKRVDTSSRLVQRLTSKFLLGTKMRVEVGVGDLEWFPILEDMNITTSLWDYLRIPGIFEWCPPLRVIQS